MEIDLSFTFIAVIFALGFIGSFLSGMLGGLLLIPDASLHSTTI